MALPALHATKIPAPGVARLEGQQESAASASPVVELHW
jgi:hypothetical protein